MLGRASRRRWPADAAGDGLSGGSSGRPPPRARRRRRCSSEVLFGGARGVGGLLGALPSERGGAGGSLTEQSVQRELLCQSACRCPIRSVFSTGAADDRRRPAGGRGRVCGARRTRRRPPARRSRRERSLDPPGLQFSLEPWRPTETLPDEKSRVASSRGCTGLDGPAGARLPPPPPRTEPGPPRSCSSSLEPWRPEFVFDKSRVASSRGSAGLDLPTPRAPTPPAAPPPRRLTDPRGRPPPSPATQRWRACRRRRRRRRGRRR